MAGIVLKVTPDALKSKASEVEASTKKLEQYFDNIQELVARSTGYWTGAAADKARKAFQEQKEDTDTVIRRFKEHPKDLLTMAGIYEEAERSAAAANMALNTDVIA